MGLQKNSALSRREINRRKLAPAIHFEIELIALALVEVRQTRTLDRADMHERIGLAIITNQKAKALHRVEELDSSGCSVSGQLTLRRFTTISHFYYLSDNLQILRRHLAAAIYQIKLQLLSFSQTGKSGTFDRADMHKNIFTTGFLLDKAESLLGVEEFHDTLAGANDLRGHSAETAASSATGPTLWATTATKAVPATGPVVVKTTRR